MNNANPPPAAGIGPCSCPICEAQRIVDLNRELRERLGITDPSVDLAGNGNGMMLLMAELVARGYTFSIDTNSGIDCEIWKGKLVYDDYQIFESIQAADVSGIPFAFAKAALAALTAEVPHAK